MELDVNIQLRITTWPGAPLPLPKAAKIASQLDGRGEVILPSPTPNEDGEEAFDQMPVELSGETYLRLAEVDLDDPEAILSFVNIYGKLGGDDAYAAIERPQHIAGLCKGALSPRRERLSKEQALRREKARVYPIRQHSSDGAITFSFSPTELIEDLDYRPDDEEWSPLHAVALLDRGPTLVETLNEFRFAAYCILDLDTAWGVLRTGEERDVVLRSVVNPPEEGWDASTLSQFLITMLGTLLQPLSPHLEITFQMAGLSDEGQGTRITGTAVEPQREPSGVPLYTLCALELFNHIVEGVEYRFCHNERCGRRFVHQQGRSQKGQRRSRGVLYCSPACARATAQREYRRRKRRDVATGAP